MLDSLTKNIYLLQYAFKMLQVFIIIIIIIIIIIDSNSFKLYINM